MLKYPSMPENGRAKLLERKLLRKKKDAEEVSNLPSMDPEDSEQESNSKKQPFYEFNSQITTTPSQRIRYLSDGAPRARFWEVWSPDAPEPDAIKPPSRRRSPVMNKSSIMSTLRAPVVVEVNDNDDSSERDIVGEDIVLKVIPPPVLYSALSRTKIPLNPAEAEFPSRRTLSVDPRFRFAPRLIFPQDVEDSNSCKDDSYTIGDEFEVGDLKVTELQPGGSRNTSSELLEKGKRSSRGSITSVKRLSSGTQERMLDLKETSEARDRDSRTSETRLSLSNKSSERKGSGASDSKEESSASKMALVKAMPPPKNELRLRTKHKKKVVKSIVRIPPITQDQWLTIQHAYNKLNPPPPRVSPTAFYARSHNDFKYPVTLPDAFQLLQEIQTVERLPDINETIKRNSSLRWRNNSRGYLSQCGSTTSGDTDAKAKVRKIRSSIRSGSLQGHRHSHVLYYVDPAIKRESLDKYDMPPAEEEDAPLKSEYELVTTINTKSNHVVTYREQRSSHTAALQPQSGTE